MRIVRRHWHRLSHHLREVVHINTSAHSIAVGFAIGTFIAVIPLFGMGVLLAVFVVFTFKNISKLALFSAMALWNPLVLVPVYWLSFAIGDAIFGPAPVVEFEVHLLNHVYLLTRRLLVGSVIIAIALSGICYFLIKAVVRRYRKHLPL